MQYIAITIGLSFIAYAIVRLRRVKPQALKDAGRVIAYDENGKPFMYLD